MSAYNSLAATERSIYLHPAGNGYLIAIAFVFGMAAVIYLYRAQQRIASRSAVAALTVLRVLLVLAAFGLLLQPSLRWTHHRSSAGALWLVLDASGSMGTYDPQATAAERLRWADALGHLPEGARSAKLDREAARLLCLRADLAALAKSTGDRPAGIIAWQKQVTAVQEQLSRDAVKQPALNAIVGTLRQISKDAAEAVTGTRSTIEQEAGLEVAAKSVGALADSVDAEFLKSHANDAAVQEAIAKVAKLSRAELAAEQLTRDGAIRRALPEYRVRVIPFADKPRGASSATAEELPDVINRALREGKASGSGTDLAAALTTVAEQSSPDEPTSVLLVSDGKQTAAVDPAGPARQLASQGAHVFALAIGSDRPIADAAVEAVDAPDWVYKDDSVKATARIRADGLADQSLTVEFLRDGEKIDSKQIKVRGGRDSQVVEFSDARPAMGVHDYSIRVPPLAAEQNVDNNAEAFRIAVRADQLKVLLVEDQPRWEYRHVVAYLSRDPRVKLQTVLLQPAGIADVTPPEKVKASPANARTEAQILPETREEWQAFDVIVLGDIPADALPEAAQQMMLAGIKDGGKSLIVIAGQRHMPGSFAANPLADALPVSIESDWSADELAEQSKKGYRAAPTPQGQLSVLSQLKPDLTTNAATFAGLPPWYWHSEQTRAKPSANVVWSIGEIDGAEQSAESQRRRALLATSSYGTGRVLYLASDQTWRLRSVGGENLQDRFWGQVIRWASGDDLPAGSKFARFGADQPKYAESQPVIVTARLTGEDLSPMTKQSFDVIARNSAPQPTVAAAATFAEVPDAPGLYRATLTGLGAGRFELSLRGATVEKIMAQAGDEKLKSLPIRVDANLTAEMRDTNPDKAKLGEIAQLGGGVAVDGPYADILAERLPRPRVEQTEVEQLGLFGDPHAKATRLTHWIFLAAFCLLITSEWVIRKAAGLV
jgi:hypothetical protein